MNKKRTVFAACFLCTIYCLNSATLFAQTTLADEGAGTGRLFQQVTESLASHQLLPHRTSKTFC